MNPHQKKLVLALVLVASLILSCLSLSIPGSVSAQVADFSFPYGLAGDIPVAGDWNGDRSDTPGVVRNANWYLSNSFGGNGDIIFNYGLASDQMVVGDWNGDGIATPGVVRGDTWYLSNTFGGYGDIIFKYGIQGDQVVVGDWNGDGIDTPGVVRNATWYLSNSFGGNGDYIFVYGLAGDRAIVGDWNGDRIDTPGVVRDATWYLSDSLGGGATYTFIYGLASDTPVVGDWNGDGLDTFGVMRGDTWYLRNSIPTSATPTPTPATDNFEDTVEGYPDFGGGGSEAYLPVWAKYAPFVSLHPNEPYYPARVMRYFLKNSKLVWSNQGVDDYPVEAQGQIVTKKLGFKSFQDTYYAYHWRAWDHTRPYDDNRESVLRDRDGFVLNLDNSKYEGQRDVTDVPVYYEYAAGRYITYWFFYAYDYAGSRYSHEGDWERIVIKLSSSNIPQKVAYYRHNCDPLILDWVTQVTRVDSLGNLGGNHPLVFSALGTHASYAQIGNGSQNNCTPVNDLVGRGVAWRTWRLMADVMKQPWYGYGGAWGEVRNPPDPWFIGATKGINSGPLGPSWYKPPAPAGW